MYQVGNQWYKRSSENLKLSQAHSNKEVQEQIEGKSYSPVEPDTGGLIY